MHRSISLVAAALAGLAAVIAVASCTAIDGRSGRTGLTSETTAAVETIAETSGAFSPPPVTPMRRVAAGSTEPAPGELEAMARRSTGEILERMHDAGILPSVDLPFMSAKLIHDQQWECTDTLEVEVAYEGIRMRVNAGSRLVESYEATRSLIVPQVRPAEWADASEEAMRLLHAFLGDRASEYATESPAWVPADAELRSRRLREADPWNPAHYVVTAHRRLDGLDAGEGMSATVGADGRVTKMSWRMRAKRDPRAVLPVPEVVDRLRATVKVNRKFDLTAEGPEYWRPQVLPHGDFYNGKVYRVRSGGPCGVGWFGIVDACTGELLERDFH